MALSAQSCFKKKLRTYPERKQVCSVLESTSHVWGKKKKQKLSPLQTSPYLQSSGVIQRFPTLLFFQCCSERNGSNGDLWICQVSAATKWCIRKSSALSPNHSEEIGAYLSAIWSCFCSCFRLSLWITMSVPTLCQGQKTSSAKWITSHNWH